MTKKVKKVNNLLNAFAESVQLEEYFHNQGEKKQFKKAKELSDTLRAKLLKKIA